MRNFEATSLEAKTRGTRVKCWRGMSARGGGVFAVSTTQAICRSRTASTRAPPRTASPGCRRLPNACRRRRLTLRPDGASGTLPAWAVGCIAFGKSEQFRRGERLGQLEGGGSALARYIHPEFGGFCLTTHFRRDVRVVAVSVLLGTMVGGVGAAIVGLNTSRSPARVSAATALVISEAGISAAEGSSPRLNDVAQNSTTKAGAPTGGGLTSALAAETSPGPKAVCSGATPENEQGCSFFKPRRVRARALTDAPDMARIAVGRITAPSTAIATQNSVAKVPGAKPAPTP